jgi:hypothetical protein
VERCSFRRHVPPECTKPAVGDSYGVEVVDVWEGGAGVLDESDRVAATEVRATARLDGGGADLLWECGHH